LSIAQSARGTRASACSTALSFGARNSAVGNAIAEADGRGKQVAQSVVIAAEPEPVSASAEMKSGPHI
jgi:hypothetical protein